MRKEIMLCVVCVIAAVGCATAPEKIDSSLLAETDAASSAKLQQTNQDIIKKRKERVAVSAALSSVVVMISASKQKIDDCTQQMKVYQAQIDTPQNDKSRTDMTGKFIDADKTTIIREKANLEYLLTYRDQLKIEESCKELEIASLFTKDDRINAQIVHDAQVQHNNPDPIKVEPYQKYYDASVRDLAVKKEEVQDASDKTAFKKEARDKTGYEAQ